MKGLHLTSHRAAALALGALLILPIRAPAAASCDDVAARGALNILTINLLFSEVEMRDDRLREVADFAAGNRIDLILLQEVVSGALVETENSARDLKDILLAEQGLDYELHTAIEAGVPEVLLSANAILSSCDIRVKLVRQLPPADELDLGDEALPFPRNVMLSRVRVPGFGSISVYNTHACSDCTPRERDRQVRAMLGFIEETQALLPGEDPVVFGGDLNTDRLRGAAEDRTYDRILTAGFIDAYAEAVAGPLDALCPETQVPDEHCTFGVSRLRSLSEVDALALLLELPFLAESTFLFELFLDELEDPGLPAARRIDYVFARGLPSVLDGLVVFNPLVTPGEPAISDHGGVFVSLELPSAPLTRLSRGF